MADSPSGKPAPTHDSAGPEAGLRVVAAKLRALAARQRPEQRLPALPPLFESAGVALEAMLDIAAAADEAAMPACAAWSTHAAQQASVDLFAFLRLTSNRLRAEIAAGPALPPEPIGATREHRGTTFWQLAALVQDIWEHAAEPSVAARDAAVLNTLDALGWPDLYDFGAGAGVFAFAAAGHGAEVCCNEANPLKRRYLRFRRTRANAVRVHLDGAAADRYWPAALAIDVLDHLPDPAAAIDALAERIAPGGHLLLQAGFPADGWHRSGDPLVATVHAALVRRFLPVDASPEFSGHGVILLRRRPAPCEVRTADAQTRIRLDPAAHLQVESGTDSFVLAAPRFYAGALRLSAAGARLASACREAPRLGELCTMLAAEGIEPDSVAAAVDAMHEARLVTLEADR